MSEREKLDREKLKHELVALNRFVREHWVELESKNLGPDDRMHIRPHSYESKSQGQAHRDREQTAWSQRQSQNVAALIESKAMSLASSNGVSSWARAKEPERRRFRHMAREQIGEATLKRIAAGRLQSASPGSAQPKADRRKNDSSAARGRKAASGLLP